MILGEAPKTRNAQKPKNKWVPKQLHSKKFAPLYCIQKFKAKSHILPIFCSRLNKFGNKIFFCGWGAKKKEKCWLSWKNFFDSEGLHHFFLCQFFRNFLYLEGKKSGVLAFWHIKLLRNFMQRGIFCIKKKFALGWKKMWINFLFLVFLVWGRKKKNLLPRKKFFDSKGLHHFFLCQFFRNFLGRGKKWGSHLKRSVFPDSSTKISNKFHAKWYIFHNFALFWKNLGIIFFLLVGVSKKKNWLPRKIFIRFRGSKSFFHCQFFGNFLYLEGIKGEKLM